MNKHLNRVMVCIIFFATMLAMPVSKVSAFDSSQLLASLEPDLENKSVYDTLPAIKQNEFKLSAFYQFPIQSSEYKGLSTHFKADHPGIDIRGNLGAEISPIYEGEVVGVGFQTGGYGNYVIVAHESGISTLYAHMLKKPAVQLGQKVTQESVLGYLGSTGRSTGPHVHFEVHTDKGYIDPLRILPPVVAGGLIAGK